jgi:hypothetical protein
VTAACLERARALRAQAREGMQAVEQTRKAARVLRLEASRIRLAVIVERARRRAR